jgi:hypothetical protein
MEDKVEPTGAKPYHIVPFHKESELLKIASWANILSKIVLGLYLLLFIIRLILEIPNLGRSSASTLSHFYTWLGVLSTPLMGLIYFVILRAISEGMNMLMVLDDNDYQMIRSRKQ